MQPACAADSSTPITNARANPSRRRSGSVATQRTQPDIGDSGRTCSDAVETSCVPAATTRTDLTVGSHSTSRSTSAASHLSPSYAEARSAANALASSTRARRTSSGAPTCGIRGTPESVRRHIVTIAGTPPPGGASLIVSAVITADDQGCILPEAVISAQRRTHQFDPPSPAVRSPGWAQFVAAPKADCGSRRAPAAGRRGGMATAGVAERAKSWRGVH